MNTIQKHGLGSNAHDRCFTVGNMIYREALKPSEIMCRLFRWI